MLSGGTGIYIEPDGVCTAQLSASDVLLIVDWHIKNTWPCRLEHRYRRRQFA